MKVIWSNDTAFNHWDNEAAYWMGNYVQDNGNVGHYTDINYANI